jgi:putative transposase
MTRTARLDYPGGIFHLISRCLDRQDLLDGDAERGRYLKLLARAQSLSDARVLSWCIMSNHVHLVVRAGDAPIGDLVRRVHTGYANWKNQREGRIGPVFASRYTAVLVEEQAYLLELVRYVHLNPVRAHVVADPAESRWSSHRIYAGLDPRPDWFDPGDLLAQFGPDLDAACAAYVRFAQDGIGEERRPDLSGDRRAVAAREVARGMGTGRRLSDGVLGSEDFLTKVLEASGDATATMGLRTREDTVRKRPSVAQLVELVCAVMGVDRSLFDEKPKRRGPRLARQVIARVWVNDYKGKQVELARFFNARVEQVSRWHANAFLPGGPSVETYMEAVNNLPLIEPDGDDPRTQSPLVSVGLDGRRTRFTLGVDVADQEDER